MNLAQKKVLVLNKSWNPIAVVGLDRALCLAIGTYANGEPKARIIDPHNDFQVFSWNEWEIFHPSETEDSIIGVNRRYRVPEIIVLGKYNTLPRVEQNKFCGAAVYKRDGYQCMYCGKKPGISQLNKDHVVPRSLGGKTEWTNVCVSCLDCNMAKADKTMEQAGMRFFLPGYKPFKPKLTLLKGNYFCNSWEKFIDERA